MDFLSSVKKHRFELILVIILLLNIPIAIYRLIPIYGANYHDEDGWLSIATWLYTKIFNPAYLTPSYVVQIRLFPNFPILPVFPNLPIFYHAKTPLYPLLIAVSTIFFRDIYVSGMFMAILVSVLLLVVVQKLAREFLHLSEDKVYMILALFASSYMAAEYFAIPVIFPFYGLLATLCIYLNLLYFRRPSIKIMACLCVSNTLSLFCHEDIWPVIFVPELFLILLYLMKGRVDYLKKYKFGLNFVILSIVATVIPVLFYGAFFIGADMWPTLGPTWANLTVWYAIYFPFEVPFEFLVSFFYTITYAWAFVFIAMRRDYRMAMQQFKTNLVMVQEGLSSSSNETVEPKSEKGHASFADQLSSIKYSRGSSQALYFDKFLMKTMLYFWLGFYFIYKMAFPGPFYPHYYYPIMFAFIFLTFQGLSTRKSYEKWFWAMILVNSILNVTQILLMVPWLYLGTVYLNLRYWL